MWLHERWKRRASAPATTHLTGSRALAPARTNGTEAKAPAEGKRHFAGLKPGASTQFGGPQAHATRWVTRRANFQQPNLGARTRLSWPESGIHLVTFVS